MKVLMTNPNFMILDEPTNDLDIDTLNVLEEFLERYNGVLLLVSHDRYLMDRLTDQLFVLEGSGYVDIYNGNYTDYRLDKDDQLKNPVKKETAISPNTPVKNKLSFKEEKQLETLENEIPQLEEEIRLLTVKLGETSSHHDLAKIAEAIEGLKNQLDDCTMLWLELIEQKESNVPRGT
jgi:ATP-binding cassette subfamily F protein uup